MVNFRIVSVVTVTTLIFLLGLYFGQFLSTYSFSDLRQSQEKILSEIMGYELAYQILVEEGGCNTSFEDFLKRRVELGQDLADLEERLGPKDPELIIQKEKYHLYQIKEFLFFKELDEKCNFSMPLIIYFYSQDCEMCDAQGKVLDALNNKNNISINTIYAFDYGIKNPALAALKNSYGITSTPALVINDKGYNKFLSLEEIEGILANHG